MKVAGIAAAAGICVAVGLGGGALAETQGHAGDLGRDQAEISQLRGQVSRLEGQLAGVRASVNGSHRDLITCGDLQDAEVQISKTMYEIGGPGQGLPATSNYVLPPHCINQ